MPNMTTLNGSNVPFLDFLAAPYVKLKYLLTPSEDYWTWLTLDGKAYEDVVLVKLDRDQVTIRHSNGVATIAKDNLNERVRNSLIHDIDTADPLDSYGLEDEYLHSLPMAH